MAGFTEQQQQALEKAYAMLGEQFNGVLIAVMAEVECPDCKGPQEAHKVYFYGGRIQAIGLCEEAKRAIQEQKQHEPDI